MSEPSLKQIDHNFKELHKEFKELKKMFSSIQKTLDLIYEDRDLLTDLQKEQEDTQLLIAKTNQHNENLNKEVKTVVSRKFEEVMDETNKMKHSMPRNLVKSIQDNFRKEKATLEKKRWWHKLTGLFKGGKTK